MPAYGSRASYGCRRSNSRALAASVTDPYLLSASAAKLSAFWNLRADSRFSVRPTLKIERFESHLKLRYALGVISLQGAGR